MWLEDLIICLHGPFLGLFVGPGGPYPDKHFGDRSPKELFWAHPFMLTISAHSLLAPYLGST